MENEEKYIEERVGKENHFRVPEGYFDSLTSRVMSQLPEQKVKTAYVQLRRWYYAAACVAVIGILGITYHLQQDDTAQQPVAGTIETNTDNNTYMDEVADYAMIDNADIYACLADN